MYYRGVVFSIFFLLFNLVCLFNLVIALLVSVYNFYADEKQGLYYNVLNCMLTRLTWDSKYGNLLVVRPPNPMFLLTLPLLPLYVGLKWCDEKLFRRVNSYLFIPLYLPQVALSILAFVVFNLALTPLAYLLTVIRLCYLIFRVENCS